MKKIIFRLFILLILNTLFTSSLSAQLIKGQVKNYQDEPISYVSIFIKELTMGTTTNEKGEFEIKVPVGSYTCSFQHLSYETVIQTIKVPITNNVKVKLPDKVYDLPMVVVGKSQEDPAYDMIRKAIGMAPFYMNQLSKYEADVYIKGTLLVEKITGLVKAMMGKDLKETQIKEGEKYLQESMNEITYNLGKYHQNVKSISNTFPEQMDIGEIGIANYNIYNPENRGVISPISPQAFSYYNFKYEGFSVEGKYIINRIKVLPKHKNAMTLEGYLYLSDGYWNVHRFELASETMGIRMTNRQAYGELEDNVWMPISNNIDAAISMMGNKASITYVTSIKYKSYTVNPKSLGKFGIIDKKVTATEQTTVQKIASEKSEKLAKEIEQIMSKGSISNREAFKVSRLMQQKHKEDNKLLPDSLKRKKSLNLTDNYKIIVDTAARKRDSIYWNEIRPVPLMDDEINSYKRKDSIKLMQNDSLRAGNFGDEVFKAIQGGRYKIDSTFTINYGGLIDPTAMGFNPVDGWVYKQKFGIHKKFKDTTNLNISLEGGYAFSRKQFMFEASAGYGYWPEKQAYISVSGGVTSSDFNYSSGLSYFDNTVTSLIFHRNFTNYYDNRYISVNNTIEITNGLTAVVGVGYHWRKQLENTTDYSFFYKDSRSYRPNTPMNPYISMDASLLADHKAAIMLIGLSYTPEMYHRYHGRSKYNIRSAYPTFGFMWRKGLSNVFGSQSNFDQLELSVAQRFNLGGMRSFRYNATGGWFPNNKQMHFRDFKNFNIKEFELSFSSFERSYNLLTTYAPATNEWYATAALQYSAPYLLLKHLPLLNRTMFQENLYLSYLTTPYIKNYTELGYGLTNIWLFGNIGAFVGFNNFEYHDWGFKVSLTF